MTTILVSNNQDFSFNLLLTNQSKSSCAATVLHRPSNTTVWVANFYASNPNGQNNPSNVNVVSLINISILFSFLL